MRAVRAVRAALDARLTGFFVREPFLTPAPALAGFSALASGSTDLLARAPGFPFFPVFPVFLELACGLELLLGSAAAWALLSDFAFFLALALGLTGFRDFLAWDEAEAAARCVWSLLVCPAIGDTIIKAKSKPATQHASTEVETGEIATLMLPL